MIPRYTRPEMAKIWEDENRFSIWLKIEILACEAMNKKGIVPDADLKRIQKRAKFSVDRINEIEEEVQHDVIAFLTNVAEHVGPSSRFIHKGMTSSDVLDTALAVQMVEAIDMLIDGTEAVRKAAGIQAKKHKYTPMIGRSHGIHAEPITFGLKMALMYDEFGRALRRLKSAKESVRVGQLSGAVGTHAHMDPSIEKYVCKKLGLKAADISTQILQRDRHAEYMNALALVACSIDRWATEFRHLQRTEVRETEEYFSKDQKGSSAMPHKRNPIIGERLSGMARLIRGYAVTGMENVALWHERDISHSSAERVIMPDATIALDYMLHKLEYMIRTLKVNKDCMKANLEMTRGLIHSQQVLLMLTEKGVSRELAYRIVQRNAMAAWEGKGTLKELLAADADVKKQIKPKDLDNVFDLSVHFRDVERTFKAVGLGTKKKTLRR